MHTYPAIRSHESLAIWESGIVQVLSEVVMHVPDDHKQREHPTKERYNQEIGVWRLLHFFIILVCESTICEYDDPCQTHRDLKEIT